MQNESVGQIFCSENVI